MKIKREVPSHLPFKFSLLLIFMMMSHCDNDLFIENNDPDAMQMLDPSLVPRATPENGRTGKNVKTPRLTGTPQQKGRAWREADSILLVKAYDWVQKTKKGNY